MVRSVNDIVHFKSKSHLNGIKMLFVVQTVICATPLLTYPTVVNFYQKRNHNIQFFLKKKSVLKQ